MGQVTGSNINKYLEYNKQKERDSDMTFEQMYPAAMALIHGNAKNPELFGKAFFSKTPSGGIMVSVEVYGLPAEEVFLGMHIHEFGECTLPFDKTGSHYNPSASEHPMHAGDMPPLLNNGGYAYMTFYTERFELEEILGKSLIIHGRRDDFTTQPSGDAGEKIGCGVIHA